MHRYPSDDEASGAEGELTAAAQLQQLAAPARAVQGDWALTPAQMTELGPAPFAAHAARSHSGG